MRPVGTTDELQRRRHLAVERLAEGYSTGEVATILSVASRSVWRWRAAFRQYCYGG